MCGCWEDPMISAKHCDSFPVIVISVGGPKTVLKMEFRNFSNFMNRVVHDGLMVTDGTGQDLMSPLLSYSLFYCNADTAASVEGKSGGLKIRGSIPLRGFRIKPINRISGISKSKPVFFVKVYCLNEEGEKTSHFSLSAFDILVFFEHLP